MKFIDKLKFDDNGLIPVVVQDNKDCKVLMVAWMNRDSIIRSMKTGKTCFWSRSRKTFWVKGEESGNFQLIREVRFDCDADTLLIKVRQVGDAACHKGFRSCFHTMVDKNGNYKVVGKRVFSPGKVYSQKRRKK